MVGAGVGDLGNFGLMPFTTSNHNVTTVVTNHQVHFDHSAETSSPGQYTVRLPGVAEVQLAASSTHSGSHQYIFNSTETTCGVLLDVCHTAMGNGHTVCRNATVNVSYMENDGIEIVAALRMSGSLTERAPQGGVMVYFAARLHNQTSMQLLQWGTGAGSRGVLFHGSCNDIIAAGEGALHINVAISFISEQHAQQNLVIQSHKASQNQKLWESMLSRFTVVSASSPSSLSSSNTLLTKFYTAIYHSYLAPSIFDEHNGDYLSFGINTTIRRVGDVPEDLRHHAYTDMSIWDIHRTQLPFLSLTLPETFTDVLSSLQFMAKQGSGDIPKWPLANIYAQCMIGSHGWVSFAEAVMKNQTRGLNLPWIYESMKRGATQIRTHSGRIAVANYTTLGYVPSEESKKSASLTLAYAFDDNAVATVGSFLGMEEEAEIFYNRSRSAYKHLWSSERQLLCPKSVVTETVKCPIDGVLPYPFEDTYTEGDALQWMWFVPHDLKGLVNLFPTNKAFVSKLQKFFQNSMSIKKGGKWAGGTVLANAWYWAGNEPNILAPWTFSFAGAQYQNYTSYWTRWLVDNAYSVNADGLPGNDDFGTLSAWLIWSVLGIYPMAGTSTFIVGAPRFESVCIQRSVGDLCVIGHNVTKPNHTHVSKLMLNGKVWDEPFFDWKDISSNNSTLEFFMGESPGRWG
jgi:predicted alpha-1,2-mannosidase